jgi:undecaprenyl diphosphate synthase
MTNTGLPRHVAIIMDGNGRWAQQRGLPRVAGHREGVKRAREIVRLASDLGIGALTLFAFSTENWSRPKTEVGMLMRILIGFLRREIVKLHGNNVRFLVIGREDPLPDYVRDELRAAERKTAANTGLTLILALNYGSRQEIVDAAARIARECLSGELDPANLDEKKFADRLYTAGIPEPDLLIRTSGEMRISNFLLWQLSYTELYFPKKHWPDFGTRDFQRALQVYRGRRRRFGSVASEENNAGYGESIRR